MANAIYPALGEAFAGAIEQSLPPVYFAGPVDYVEHRSPGRHVTDNWRHRMFNDLPIKVLCPTCLNAPRVTHVHAMEGCRPECEVPMTTGRTFDDIMQTNKAAMERARFFVGYFPGDVATFGTPIEVWHWVTQQPVPDRAILIHPAQMGVFVEYLAAHEQLMVVRTFEEARSWLLRRLSDA